MKIELFWWNPPVAFQMNGAHRLIWCEERMCKSENVCKNDILLMVFESRKNFGAEVFMTQYEKEKKWFMWWKSRIKSWYVEIWSLGNHGEKPKQMWTVR